MAVLSPPPSVRPRLGEERLRVLVVHNRYQHAGGERRMVEAETALLARRGHAVERYELDNEAVDAMNPVHLAARALWSREAYRAVRDRARAMRADVVHLHNWLPLVSPSAVWGARRAGAAVVHTLHNYRLVCPGFNLMRDGSVCELCVGKKVALPAIRHGCYRGSAAASGVVAGVVAGHRALGTWARGVDRFVAVGPFIRDKVVEGGVVPAEKVVVKPNFLDDDPPAGTGPRAGVLFVGRFVEEKGVGVLLAAWHARRDLPTLTLVGDGPLEGLVRAASEGLPHVEWAGRLPREAVLARMREAEAVVVPSTWYEGCPMTIVEAYASGTPVVGSALGAVGQMVREGETGALFEVGDAAALGEAVLRATASGSGAGARAEYEREYSAGLAYDRLVGVYREAVAERVG